MVTRVRYSLDAIAENKQEDEMSNDQQLGLDELMIVNPGRRGQKAFC